MQIITRINRKRNSPFLIQINSVFLGDWLGVGEFRNHPWISWKWKADARTRFYYKVSLRKENIRKFFESAEIQLRFIENEYELIYIDEFTQNSRENRFYSWTRKGSKGFIEFEEDQFSMSFIIAFSWLKFYGVFGKAKITDSLSFIWFLENLIESRMKLTEVIPEKSWIILDNCSIHTSKDVEEYAKQTNISLVTIWPYSPSLNPWEKVISSVKERKIFAIGWKISLKNGFSIHIIWK